MHGFLWGTNYFSSSNFHISPSAGNCDRTTLLQVQHYPLQVQHYPNLCLNDLPLTTMLILKFEVFDWKSSGVAQWVAHLARNADVLGSSPIKGHFCFLEQETLPLLLSTGWFLGQIRA